MKPLIIDREIVLGNRVILCERSRENHEDGECRCQQGQQNAAALQMGTHRILHSNATTSTTERFKCRIKLSGAGMVRNILLADSGAYKVPSHAVMAQFGFPFKGVIPSEAVVQ